MRRSWLSGRRGGAARCPQIDLYLHIPFCTDLCPYNRIPYQEHLVAPYVSAVLSEIEAYRQRLGRLRVSSICIGGGTPTTGVDELGLVLEGVRASFDVIGPICLETNPLDITQETLAKLRSYTVGRFLALKRVRMPDLAARRRMCRFIHGFCESHGFRRASVRGFLRGHARRYSSVTRDLYLGLGAGSHLPGVYHLSTFSVDEYITTCQAGHLPIALRMGFTPALSQFHWLYRRLYNTYVPKSQFTAVFNSPGVARRADHLLRLSRWLRLCDEDEAGIRLNERGAFWLHLMQNHFSLDYINRIWSAARAEPWPQLVRSSEATKTLPGYAFCAWDH